VVAGAVSATVDGSCESRGGGSVAVTTSERAIHVANKNGVFMLSVSGFSEVLMTDSHLEVCSSNALEVLFCQKTVKSHAQDKRLEERSFLRVG
jgi:hypothetical protein